MIEKILSGGRPGTEQAALDAAIKLGLAFGGWIPKGKAPAVIGGVDTYNLVEMTSPDWSEACKLNIRNAEGTLILSHGQLPGTAQNIAKMVRRYSKPLFHMDLTLTSSFNAATKINDWIMENDISMLHVAGPLEKEDRRIYKATLDILQAVYFLNLTETSMNLSMGSPDMLSQVSGKTSSPKTMHEAVDTIIHAMHLKDRTLMANMRQEEIASLQLTLGLYIQKKLDAWSEEPTFRQSCLDAARKEQLDPSNMPMVLIKMVWKQLRDTHRLRIVK